MRGLLTVLNVVFEVETARISQQISPKTAVDAAEQFILDHRRSHLTRILPGYMNFTFGDSKVSDTYGPLVVAEKV